MFGQGTPSCSWASTCDPGLTPVLCVLWLLVRPYFWKAEHISAGREWRPFPCLGSLYSPCALWQVLHAGRSQLLFSQGSVNRLKGSQESCLRWELIVCLSNPLCLSLTAVRQFDGFWTVTDSCPSGFIVDTNTPPCYHCGPQVGVCQGCPCPP